MMKVITLFMLLISLSLNSAPMLKMYLSDGSTKSYQLSEIDNMSFADNNSIMLMKIYMKNNSTENYQLKYITSIGIRVDSSKYEYLDLKYGFEVTSYKLLEIDSINFFIPDVPIPSITDINPVSAKIGDEITINGVNFESAQGKSIVTFKGKNAIDYISWTDTQIKVKVPSGAQTGKLAVEVKGIKSNEADFSVIPVLTSMTPTSLRIGDNVTVKGTGLGNTQGTSTITFNGINGNVTSWSDSQILVKIPKGAQTGKVAVTSSSIKSNELDFTVLPGIENISASSARIGDTVRITGLAFGTKRDSSIISFTGKNAVDYISWSDTAIKVRVPLGAKTGKIGATINKVKINEFDFSIIPTITKITPDSAGVSEQITISGNGFGDKKGTVSFNGNDTTDCPEWSDIFIRVYVPPNTKSGKLYLTSGNIKSNEVDYFIIQHITSITPASAKVGDYVSILGTDFGENRDTNGVYFNGELASEYQSWSQNEIVVKVPDNASNGTVNIKIGKHVSNNLNFQVIPVFSSISPSSFQLGGIVTLSGTGFGLTRGSSSVKLTGVTLNAGDYIGWSSKTITLKIPNGTKTGQVSVTIGNSTTNEIQYTILPTIVSISSSIFGYGDEVTIYGASFGETRGASSVSFNGMNATEYTFWCDTTIKVKVPFGASNGNMYATIGTNSTNQMNYTLKPYISGISPNTGSVNDIITISGSNFGTSRGTNYVTFNNKKATIYDTWTDNQIVTKVPSGTKTGNLTVTVNNEKSNSAEFSFIGANLESVTIGTQTWTLKNLDVTTYRNGDAIPQCTSATQWSNLGTGAWCYYDFDENNGQVYGKLYNWHAVNDSRGLAPEGWHVPDTSEISILNNYLGGRSVAGGKMKETGTSHWSSPNTGASNESGFTALPGGCMLGSPVGFIYKTLRCIFWLANESSEDQRYAWCFVIYYNYEVTEPSRGGVKMYGNSVRLIKD